ncbi:MAG: L-asparaginase [Marivirga sp.]|jgi:L-asparaginase
MKDFYELITLTTAAPKAPNKSLMIIYTGGTLGMVYDDQQSLVPFNFENILEALPSLRNFNLHLKVAAFSELIDSSNINPKHWAQIAQLIEDNYEQQDGFIVIHGTDTMSFTASALSFMLEGLNKPVIFTGAQLPIGAARSDARENLITAIEIASQSIGNRPIVSEVCIYFNNLLLRGNRSKKVESVQFDAFESENYPVLAEAGVIIEYNFSALKAYDANASLNVRKDLNQEVAVLKIFPGISPRFMKSVLESPGLKGVVLETFGAGNAPSDLWFVELIESAIKKGILILNVSQCVGGKVIQGRYETSKKLEAVGVCGGSDITTEAAITKMMYILSYLTNQTEQRLYLTKSLRGEME